MNKKKFDELSKIIGQFKPVYGDNAERLTAENVQVIKDFVYLCKQFDLLDAERCIGVCGLLDGYIDDWHNIKFKDDITAQAATDWLFNYLELLLIAMFRNPIWRNSHETEYVKTMMQKNRLPINKRTMLIASPRFIKERTDNFACICRCGRIVACEHQMYMEDRKGVDDGKV